jgi:hypothetical protein
MVSSVPCPREQQLALSFVAGELRGSHEFGASLFLPPELCEKVPAHARQ